MLLYCLMFFRVLDARWSFLVVLKTPFLHLVCLLHNREHALLPITIKVRLPFTSRPHTSTPPPTISASLIPSKIEPLRMGRNQDLLLRVAISLACWLYSVDRRTACSSLSSRTRTRVRWSSSYLRHTPCTSPPGVFCDDRRTTRPSGPRGSETCAAFWTKPSHG